MSVLVKDNSVLKSIGGEVYSETADASNLILHIDTDLQFSNRIHKSATDNKVKQITDKAQGIAFTQTDVNKQPVYNYEGYYSFDGVNDVINGQKQVIDYSKPFTVEFWFYPLQLTQFTLFAQRLNGNNSEFLTCYCFDSSLDILGYIGGVSRFIVNINTSNLLINQWNHVYFIISPRQGTAIVNGIMKNGSVYSDFTSLSLSLNIPLQIGNEYERGGFFFSGNLKNLIAYNTYNNDWLYRTDDLSSVRIPTGTQVFTPEQPFHHYVRYPDNGFISSKYLKDAVIDSADNITSLKSSIGTDVFTFSTNKPTWTKKGLLFASGQILQSANTYTFGTSNFYIGLWANPTANADILSFGTSIKIGKDATNDYFETNGTKTYASQTITGYKYYALIRISGVLYFLINGQLQATKTESIDYSTALQVIVGGTYAGLFDEPLFSIGDSIIDPTGFSVNQKCFEPPTRGGFDGTFKIYTIP